MAPFEQDVAPVCGFNLRQLNDKIARVLLKLHSNSTHQQLLAETDPLMASRLCLALFCAASFSLIPYTSAKLVPATLEICKASSSNFAKEKLPMLTSAFEALNTQQNDEAMKLFRSIGEDALAAVTASLKTKNLAKSGGPSRAK
jgi:hypothetical protein